MNEFDDFLKAIAEGKKQAEEASPGKKALKALKEDLVHSNPFATLPLAAPKGNPLPYEIVGEFILENGEYKSPVGQMLTEIVVPEVKPAAEQVPQATIDKYLRQGATFQQPNPEKVDPTLRAVQDKLKFVEQWLGKIAATGPGSGEVNFRWLDDVNRSTMGTGNNNWLLEYDTTSKKVQFTENVGPIRTLALNLEGPQTPLVPGQLAWNPNEDCLDIKHEDGSTVQVGLEQHMIVHNSTASLIPNGTVVRFAGTALNGDINPAVEPHIANGTIPPLYTVGVLTNDLPVHETGRATTFGKARNLNTTGSDVGETWAEGDVLYVSPTVAGKLTKFKPTAPNIVVVVAAVMRVSATDGILLVRPTIFPRLYYGSFSDTTDQTAAVINTPYAIKYNTTDIANGHSVIDDSKIVAQNSGLYNYQFSLQLSSNSASQKQVYIWARKNGVDIPNSTSRITIAGNGYYSIAAWNFIVSMDANNYFQLMWAVNDTGARIDAPPATAFTPATPSVILTVTEAAL